MPRLTVWVDADSCPTRVREIICAASTRRGVDAVFVANRKIPLPESGRVSTVVVDEGDQSADAYLVEHARCGDLAVTRDIPLAAQLVGAGLTVLNDRGDVFTEANVRERLSIRDHMYELRTSGIMVGEQSRYGKREIYRFSNAFDRELTRVLNQKSTDSTV